MANEDFELKPSAQCTITEKGNFGQLLKEVYQGHSGILATQETWEMPQWENVPLIIIDRLGTGRLDRTAIDMDFGGEIYRFGKDTKSLSINSKLVYDDSPQLKEGIAKMGVSMLGINFDAPRCPFKQGSNIYEDLGKVSKEAP